MKKSGHGKLMHDTSIPLRFRLDDSPSHLLHRVLQIALDIYNAELGEGAVSQRQYAVLSALDGAEGLSQADLVKATGIDRSTLADLVARMVTKGLIVRERSSTDGRANLVQLTGEGRAALVEAGPKVAAADAKILELLSPPKRDSFVKLLRKLAHARADTAETAKGKPDKHEDGQHDGGKSDAKALKKAAKKKKKPEDKAEKRAGKLAKKLKKLPMPGLSEGVAGPAEDLVHAPEDKAV